MFISLNLSIDFSGCIFTQFYWCYLHIFFLCPFPIFFIQLLHINYHINFQGDFAKAAEIVGEAGDRASAYHFARQLEARGQFMEVWYGMVDQILIDTIRYDLIEDDLWWFHFGILLLQFLFLSSRCLHFDFSPILSISIFLSFIFPPLLILLLSLLSSPYSITFHPILSPFVLFIFFLPL